MRLTLESIKARCEEEGDCWIWQQGTNSMGQPNARDGDKSVQVRRRVWELSHVDRDIGKGMFVIAGCTHKLCVSPTCALRLNGRQYMAWLNKHGKVNTVATQAARTAAVRARPATKLTLEKAAELAKRINAGEDRGTVAADYGISRCHANRVARGDQWAKPPIPNSSIFNLAQAS